MYQSLTIIGRLGRDPEMKYMPNGDPLTTFSVATDRQYNDKSGQKVKETTWFRVTAWQKQAENCNTFLKKGSMVLVEGRLVVDPKTGGPKTFTRQDGTLGTSFEINANTVRFLSTKGDGDAERAATRATAAPDAVEEREPVNAEDIPF